jgi:metallo-beta-lactamase family protein
MAEAGRIKHHIANHINDVRCCILLVGYTSPDSLGGQLKSGQNRYIFSEKIMMSEQKC